MPRVKDASDWLLTWSPDSDTSVLPPILQQYLDGENVSRYITVVEKAEKTHIHCVFSTTRSYNSDYKWYKDLFPGVKLAEGKDGKGGGLQIKFAGKTPLLIAGGYLDGTIIGRRGFRDEQLKYGNEQYKLRKERQEIRGVIDDLIVISPQKLDATIGTIMARFRCDESEAEILAANMGFAFQKKGIREIYKDQELERLKHM